MFLSQIEYTHAKVMSRKQQKALPVDMGKQREKAAEAIFKSYDKFKEIFETFKILLVDFRAISVYMLDPGFSELMKDAKHAFFANWFDYYIGLRDEFILLHNGVVMRKNVSYGKFANNGKCLRDLKPYEHERDGDDNDKIETDPRFFKVDCSERGLFFNIKKLGVSMGYLSVFSATI